WVWLAVYFTVPPLLSVIWLLQALTRGGKAPREAPLRWPLRIALILLAAAMLILGLAQTLAPWLSKPPWPWTLTPVDSLYGLTDKATMETYVGVWFLSWAVLAI